MSFQDLEGTSRASSRRQTGKPTVAAGIFQINTVVAGFRRLVDAVGTAKDTAEHRQKLHSARQRIGQLVKKEISARLKALSDADRNVPPSKKLEDSKLARDFQAVLQEFQKAQKLAAEREAAYATPPSPSLLQTSLGSDELATAEMNSQGQRLLGEQQR